MIALTDCVRHPDTWLELEQLQAPTPTPYRKTFEFAGEYIDPTHEWLGGAPLGRMGIPICIDVGIDGYLQRPDALKLYELARLSSGDVLELGTYCGLSTLIIAKGLEARGDGSLETVDIGDQNAAIAALGGLGRRVRFTRRDATMRLDELLAERRRYGFIFVDHWHGYDSTLEAATRGRQLLEPGGFILFHDCLDPGNADPSHPYGVYQAVKMSYGEAADDMAFYGNFGCCGLYRRTITSTT